ncbi:MAG: AMP-binding protein [Parabacteroides sp.]
MNPTYQPERSLQRITVEGVTYTAAEIAHISVSERTPEMKRFVEELKTFLQEWFDPSPTLTVHTSGSTGVPKALCVRKMQMIQSAQMTCRFLELKTGDSALLCMPLRYIAGKMVVVRALVAQLDLRLAVPSGHPLAHVDSSPTFAAMIPLQIYNSLQRKEEQVKLMGIKQLLIGGGAIDTTIEQAISKYPGGIYSTYGMTETLSHIALRRLNGKHASPHYRPLEGVRVSLSKAETLCIEAPLVCDQPLVTNDVACLYPDGSFTILGRKDNIINTGGIKVQIEEVEQRLKTILPRPFAITSLPDPKFGERIILLFAGDTLAPDCLDILPKYQRPKAIFYIKEIPLTETGKINRPACRSLAAQLQKEAE